MLLKGRRSSPLVPHEEELLYKVLSAELQGDVDVTKDVSVPMLKNGRGMFICQEMLTCQCRLQSGGAVSMRHCDSVEVATF